MQKLGHNDVCNTMILILTILIVSTYLFHLLYWRRKNLPPGPAPAPLLGNLYLMKKELQPGYQIWKNLTNQYGPVYTFWMANMPIVMVTDWQLIKQSFIKDGNSYVDRAELPMAMVLRKGPYGIIESYGDRWVQQRRFALQVLRDFGMGKNLMEEKAIGEFQSLMERVKKDQAENGMVDMQDYLDASIGSIINSVLFGYRYDETNMKDFLLLKDKLDKFMRLAGDPVGIIIYMYPWTANLPYFSKHMKVIKNNWESMMELFRKQIEEKQKTIDYDNDEYSDYVEAFLKERKKREIEPNFGGYELEQLDSVCFDLWIAGMETTSNTLYWAILYILVNDDVKQKIYEELDSKIGSDRIVTMSDKNELNYINATINEIQRTANLLPLNVNRVTTKDVEIGGHFLPKGTYCQPVISQVLYDERIFPEPEKFKPERFLDSEGNLKKVEEFMPFSVGKRQCVGEGLAKLELFIFFANIFNQFDISLDPSNPLPSLEKEYGSTMKAKNYKLCMKSRHF